MIVVGRFNCFMNPAGNAAAFFGLFAWKHDKQKVVILSEGQMPEVEGSSHRFYVGTEQNATILRLAMLNMAQ